jgi:hypothetical protein
LANGFTRPKSRPSTNYFYLRPLLRQWKPSRVTGDQTCALPRSTSVAALHPVTQIILTIGINQRRNHVRYAPGSAHSIVVNPACALTRISSEVGDLNLCRQPRRRALKQREHFLSTNIEMRLGGQCCMSAAPSFPVSDCAVRDRQESFATSLVFLTASWTEHK